jgi:hypothetical protein
MNMAASVHARLAERARRTDRPFQEILQYYAMERFLYRLCRSPYAERFVLKGALMLRVWDAPTARPTKDVDLLGRMANSLDNLSNIVREICVVEVEPDGLVFKEATVKAGRIKPDADYQGVRVRFDGLLGKARIAMQLDVGFGDVVMPGPQDIDYPTLLDLPAPRLKGYPRESVIAEKFEAMVKLGTLNSRDEGLLRHLAALAAVRLRRRDADPRGDRHFRQPQDDHGPEARRPDANFLGEPGRGDPVAGVRAQGEVRSRAGAPLGNCGRGGGVPPNRSGPLWAGTSRNKPTRSSVGRR